MDSGQADEVIDAGEAARRLGVSKALIYKLLREGRLRGFLVGSRKKIYLSSVIEWQRKYAIGPPLEEPPAKPPVGEPKFAPRGEKKRQKKKKS